MAFINRDTKIYMYKKELHEDSLILCNQHITDNCVCYGSYMVLFYILLFVSFQWGFLAL